MAQNFATGFLTQSISRLEGNKQMADKAICQLSDDQLFTPVWPGSNSVAVIMQHMAGNMESRWTNFLTEDGEKPWRKRDQEFEPVLIDRGALLAYWEKGWSCLLATLKSLQPEDMEKEITIRGEALAVYEAIIRQLLHYSGHVGQIIFAAKGQKGVEWKPLTIAKDQSKAYNQSMGFLSR